MTHQRQGIGESGGIWKLAIPAPQGFRLHMLSVIRRFCCCCQCHALHCPLKGCIFTKVTREVQQGLCMYSLRSSAPQRFSCYAFGGCLHMRHISSRMCVFPGHGFACSRKHGRACTHGFSVSGKEDMLFGCFMISSARKGTTHCCPSRRGCACPDPQSRQSFRCLNAHRSIRHFLPRFCTACMCLNAQALHDTLLTRSEHSDRIHGSGKAGMKSSV